MWPDEAPETESNKEAEEPRRLRKPSDRMHIAHGYMGDLLTSHLSPSKHTLKQSVTGNLMGPYQNFEYRNSSQGIASIHARGGFHEARFTTAAVDKHFEGAGTDEIRSVAALPSPMAVNKQAAHLYSDMSRPGFHSGNVNADQTPVNDANTPALPSPEAATASLREKIKAMLLARGRSRQLFNELSNREPVLSAEALREGLASSGLCFKIINTFRNGIGAFFI